MMIPTVVTITRQTPTGKDTRLVGPFPTAQRALQWTRVRRSFEDDTWEFSIEPLHDPMLPFDEHGWSIEHPARGNLRLVPPA